MFEQNPYYHRTIKNTVVALGNLFSGITIRHYDTNNVLVKSIRTPIAYAAKEKWFNRLQGDPEFAQKFSVELPKLSFEITGYQYDASRKLGAQRAFIPIICNGVSKLYAPVPYNLNVALYSYTKTQDDNLQILEQILPFFQPNMIINMELLETENIKKDVSVELSGISPSDTYEGLPDDTRMIITQYNFTVKIDLFGPVSNNYQVIKKTIVDMNSNTNINSAPLQTYHADVNPFEANENDSFTIDEEWV